MKIVRALAIAAAVGFASTALPVSAARVDFFTPFTEAVNPKCVEADGFTAQPSIARYTGFADFIRLEVADDNNADTMSTYVKGDQACVRADWHFDPAGFGAGTCQYWFYVPNDVQRFQSLGVGANATIVVGFYGPDRRTLARHDSRRERINVGSGAPARAVMVRITLQREFTVLG
jgi:hypothetical protein